MGFLAFTQKNPIPATPKQSSVQKGWNILKFLKLISACSECHLLTNATKEPCFLWQGSHF
jgi:hypothetical protein